MAESKLTVYLCGPHSSGKSTLQGSLQKHQEFSKHGFKSQDELARRSIIKSGITPDQLRHPKTLLEVCKYLVENQYKEEEMEIEEHGGKYSKFLWDRGIMDPIAYVKVYVGAQEAEKLLETSFAKETFERWRRGEDCMIFLIKPVEDFIEFDGVRIESKLNEVLDIYETMRSLLDQQEIEYVVIDCRDLDERTKIVVDAVKKKWGWSV